MSSLVDTSVVECVFVNMTGEHVCLVRRYSVFGSRDMLEDKRLSVGGRMAHNIPNGFTSNGISMSGFCVRCASGPYVNDGSVRLVPYEEYVLTLDKDRSHLIITDKCGRQQKISKS